MPDWISTFSLFAQGNQGGQPGLPQWLMLIVPIAVLFYLLIIRPQRREQAKRDELLKSLQKNDRVVTIGGMIGSIASLSQDGKEVTLKVDDNTRIKMLRSSIQNVLRDDEQETSADKS